MPQWGRFIAYLPPSTPAHPKLSAKSGHEKYVIDLRCCKQTQTCQDRKTHTNKTLSERKGFPRRGKSVVFTSPCNPRWLLPLPFSAASGKQPGSSGAESGEATAEAPGAGSALRVRGCQRARRLTSGAWGYDAFARMARCQSHWPPAVINQPGAGGAGEKERQALGGAGAASASANSASGGGRGDGSGNPGLSE